MLDGSGHGLPLKCDDYWGIVRGSQSKLILSLAAVRCQQNNCQRADLIHTLVPCYMKLKRNAARQSGPGCILALELHDSSQTQAMHSSRGRG